MKTLKDIALDAISAVDSGYYDVAAADIDKKEGKGGPATNVLHLTNAIVNAKAGAIICEVKFASPSAGTIRNHGEVKEIVSEMESGGAIGLSVLTESKNFGGSISNLLAAREITDLPIIMKDIIVSSEQIEAAKKIGASAVLFIEEVYSDGLSKDGLSLDEAVDCAKRLGLDTIIETHSAEGLEKISKIKTDVVGINNRDLKTFETNIDTTFELLKNIPKKASGDSRLIMSESGYESADDIRSIVKRLQENDLTVPDAFLIGTSVMRSERIREKVRSFAEGLNSQWS